VRDELSKLLTCGAPDRGMLLAQELGLLPLILPPVTALEGLAQSPPHVHDVFTHTVRLLHYLVQIERLITGRQVAAGWSLPVEKLLSPYRAELLAHLARPVDGGFNGRLLLYWGGLLHDTGKREAQTVDSDGRIRFIGHDDAGAVLTGRLLTSLKFSNDAIRYVRQIVAGHMRPLFLAAERAKPSRKASYRYFRALREAGVDVGILSLADHLATYEGIGDDDSWDALLEVVSALFNTYYTAYERVVAPPRLLDGKDIQQLLGLTPGREIGRLLGLLEEAQAIGQITTRAEAVEFIQHSYSG
jgi:tRNA nucleotidyltransferase/poly(A) polymerase